MGKKQINPILNSYIKFLRLGLFTLLLAGVCQGAPGWGLDNSYEDMMRAFGTFKPPFKKFDSMIGGEISIMKPLYL